MITFKVNAEFTILMDVDADGNVDVTFIGLPDDDDTGPVTFTFGVIAWLSLIHNMTTIARQIPQAVLAQAAAEMEGSET